MPQQQTFQTQIVFSGEVNESLGRALGFTKNQMLQLQGAMKTIQSLSGKSNAQLKVMAPHIQAANTQAVALTSNLQKVKTIATGIVIGETIETGIRLAIRAVKDLVGELGKLGCESLRIAGEYDKLKWGFENAIGNRAEGNMIAEQMFRGGAQGPGGKSLLEAAKQLAGHGLSGASAAAEANMLGNLICGAGGDKEDLCAFTTAVGRTMTRGYADTRSLVAMQKIGLPVEEMLVKLYGSGNIPGFKGGNITNKKGDKLLEIVPEGLARVQYMLNHHLVTMAMFQKALEEFTKKGGQFYEGMKEWSHHWAGALETFNNHMELTGRQFGELLMETFTPLLVWINETIPWDRITDYFSNLQLMSKDLVSFIGSMPSSDLIEAFKPYMLAVQRTFDSFNNWIGSFFTIVEIPNVGNEIVTTATGQDQVKTFLDQLAVMVTKLGEVLGRIAAVGNRIGQAITNLEHLHDFFENIIPIFRLTDLIDNLIYGGQTPNKVDAGTDAWLNQYSRNQGGYHMHHYASGGIVTGPQIAMLGEVGSSEVVIPLRNAEVLDDLADSIQQLNEILSGISSGQGMVGAAMGGGVGGARGSMLKETEYGPAVDYVDSQ